MVSASKPPAGEQARVALGQKKYDESYSLISRVQKILTEMSCTLKHDVYPELCGKLAALYTYEQIATAEARELLMKLAGAVGALWTLVPAVRRRRSRLRSPIAVAAAAAALAVAALVGAEVSARVHPEHTVAAGPDMRLASLDLQRAQADMRLAYLERQFSLRSPDPILDRSVARQLLG